MPLTDHEYRRAQNLSPHEKARCEHIVRAFAAEMLGAGVGSTGQVLGWNDFLSGLHDQAQGIVRSHYQWACAYVVLRRMDEASTIARAVVSCQHALRTFTPQHEESVDPAQVAGAVASLGRALKW